MVRAKNFDIAIKKFIENHPSATIVNIGAGLDTTFYRVDNGTIKWYDLDLPSAILFRKKFLSESERNKFISKSALDYSWFDETEYELEKGIFSIAGGFIYYFNEETLLNLMIEMAKHFPKAEFIFDATSKFANSITNFRAKKAGNNEFRFYLGVNDLSKIFPRWFSKIQIHDWYTFWARTKINPNWNEKIISAIKKSERIKAAKIIHLKFIKIGVDWTLSQLLLTFCNLQDENILKILEDLSYYEIEEMETFDNGDILFKDPNLSLTRKILIVLLEKYNQGRIKPETLYNMIRPKNKSYISTAIHRLRIKNLVHSNESGIILTKWGLNDATNLIQNLYNAQ